MSESSPDPAAIEFLNTEIRALLRVVAASDLTSLDLEQDGISVSLKRRTAIVLAPSAAEPATAAAPLNIEDNTFHIVSPVVGWFRYGDTPQGAPPLVEVGQAVKSGQRLGMIEAVEVVHTVTADRDGVLVEVLAADGAGVEYGQPLFVLKP